MNPRLQKQLEFIMEIDKLKHIFRRSKLMNRSRFENDAEHSWHLAVMAMLLEEYAGETELNRLRVLHMLLIHDLVEIDAGDTFAYDAQGHEDKQEREENAARRLFFMLPPDQAEWIYGLWREFEERQTPESRFAAALDRLQPLIHNYYTEGESWKLHGIRRQQVLDRNRHIAEGSPELWELARHLIEDAVRKGYLAE
ncbi:HD domain-containing protein [Paenibacillus hamazuiensis]|uniref:HD domain-containing protein n=1 Tax=Paenibacillus hamazuiensis TaxID=2936508 RepID=UPI0020109BB2|nr:HD domain-containing protein [Paenibacillus hamazuiensis]